MTVRQSLRVQTVAEDAPFSQPQRIVKFAKSAILKVILLTYCTRSWQ